MTQPIWKLLTATDYFAVFEDTTGQYPPEIEYADHDGENDGYDCDDDATFTVYRWSLDQLHYDDENDLVNYVGNKEWFQSCHAGLDAVAASCGRTTRDLEDALASDDVMARAMAYLDIAGYHGAINFDQYPLTHCSAKHLTERWS